MKKPENSPVTGYDPFNNLVSCSNGITPTELVSSRMETYPFESNQQGPERSLIPPEDLAISENYCFTYPVVIPGGQRKYNRVIFYLHGLNERSWNKHTSGAVYLAEKTRTPVIMFPLSFHINRGSPLWSDLRKLSGPLGERRNRYPDVQGLSVVNLTLSRRLTESPERFFLAGFQSATDLLRLMGIIYAGDHPLFEKGTQADFFAYSISCLMMQALIISDTEGRFRDSRFVFFAGGALLSLMKGSSRYILDSVAFLSLISYYSKPVGMKRMRGGIQELYEDHQFGRAFQMVIDPDRYSMKRENTFSLMVKRLKIIALAKDKVIPVEGIRAAFGRSLELGLAMDILHFGHPYSHENPFPFGGNLPTESVFRSFQLVYGSAASFLGRTI